MSDDAPERLTIAPADPDQVGKTELGDEPRVADELPPFDADNEITEITLNQKPIPKGNVGDRGSLTLLTGRQAGRVMTLPEAALVIGRSSKADFVVEDTGVSRQHARIQRWVGMAHALEDLESTNGTYVNGVEIKRTPLKHGDRIQLGPRTLFRFAITDEVEEKVFKGLYEARLRDPNTFLYGRQHLLDQLRLEVACSRRHNHPTAIAMWRLQGFSKLVAKYGADIADGFLREAAVRAAACSRIEDLCARHDQGNFALVLRMTDLKGAHVVDEKVRFAIADSPIVSGDLTEPVVAQGAVAALEELPMFAGSEALLELAESRLRALS